MQEKERCCGRFQHSRKHFLNHSEKTGYNNTGFEQQTVDASRQRFRIAQNPDVEEPCLCRLKMLMIRTGHVDFKLQSILFKSSITAVLKKMYSTFKHIILIVL